MAAWERDTPWRQGHVLSNDAAKALAVLQNAPATDAITVAVVVSHDCDLAQSPHIEPDVEVITGCQVKPINGNFTHGKNARRLHLTFTGGSEYLAVELIASRKTPVGKTQLAEFAPLGAVRLTPVELVILQRWLAARYRRSAFPDEFDRRLEDTGVRDRLVKIFKSFGAHISSVYFDVDNGEEIARSGPDDPYKLDITLLFNTETDPEAAETAANVAAAAIKKAFREKCLPKENGPWRNIELVWCDAVSDQAMTVQQAERLKKWSADHISLRADSPQPMLNNA